MVTHGRGMSPFPNMTWRDTKGGPFRNYVKFFSLVAWKITKRKDRSICSACCLITRRNLPNSLALNDPVNAPVSAEFHEKANRLNEFCSEGLAYRVRRGKEESNERQLRVQHHTSSSPHFKRQRTFFLTLASLCVRWQKGIKYSGKSGRATGLHVVLRKREAERVYLEL